MKALYKDKFVEVTPLRLTIKCYYFPIATSKSISINSIRAVYYKSQTATLPVFSTKAWGMSLTPVWWACDVRRKLRSKNSRSNVIIDTGKFTKKGFTVKNISEFLRVLRPLTNAPCINRIPDTFDERPLPIPIMRMLAEDDERCELEDDDDEGQIMPIGENKDEIFGPPPSYDEAMEVAARRLH